MKLEQFEMSVFSAGEVLKIGQAIVNENRQIPSGAQGRCGMGFDCGGGGGKCSTSMNCGGGGGKCGMGMSCGGS